MAARRPTKRKPLRDMLADANRWDRFYALSAGMEPRAQSVIPEKRAYAKREPDGTYESDIQRDIIEMLKRHPKVAIIERHNSGASSEIGADGKLRFVRFNTVYRVNGVRMRKSDIDCTLVNGKRFVVEVKRPPWRGPTDQREYEQENYINHVRAATGYGLFATSVAEVEEALAAIKIIEQ